MLPTNNWQCPVLPDFEFDTTGAPIQHRGDITLRGKGQLIPYTEKYITEVARCTYDIFYFLKNYYYIINLDRGKEKIDLYDYQKEIVDSLANNRRTIVNTARQCGKTTTIAAFALWYALFHSDKTIAVLAHQDDMAMEIVDRIKTAYAMLPKWLQQGVLHWTRHGFELENGSRVISKATTEKAARGFSINFLIMDEFAFVDGNKARAFLSAVMPTISSSQTAKVAIISTPNGYNHFYKFWNDSKQGLNDYVRIEAPWWRVPGRDEKWKEATIRNDCGGDIEQFEQEYECSFIGGTNTLIPKSVLARLAYESPLNSESGEMPETLSIYEEVIDDHIYVLSVDSGRGKSRDASAFSIIDVTNYPFRQVLRYSDNKVSHLEYPNIVFHWASIYNDAMLIVENNEIGQAVADTLWYGMEYTNMWNSGTDIGFRTTKKTKKLGCMNLKSLMETNRLIVKDFETISEMTMFVEKKNGSYAAEEGQHDDIMMGLVNFGYFMSTDFFADMTNGDTLNKLAIKEKAIASLEEEAGFVVFGDEDVDADSQEAFMKFLRS